MKLPLAQPVLWSISSYSIVNLLYIHVLMSFKCLAFTNSKFLLWIQCRSYHCSILGEWLGIQNWLHVQIATPLPKIPTCHRKNSSNTLFDEAGALFSREQFTGSAATCMVRLWPYTPEESTRSAIPYMVRPWPYTLQESLQYQQHLVLSGCGPPQWCLQG